MKPEVRSLWARARLLVHPGRLVIASLPKSLAHEAVALVAEASGFACFLLEGEAISLTLPEDAWRRSPLRSQARAVGTAFRAITIELELDLSVSGFLAPAAERLARRGVAIVPQCGYLKDHLLVSQDHLETAVAVLEEFIAECRRLGEP